VKKALTQCALGVLGAATLFGAGARPSAEVKITKGAPVVRVNSTNQSYDAARPWAKKPHYTRRGTGAIVTGGDVLVTAELVADHTYAELEKPATAAKCPATVVAVDYEANLALLRPAEAGFLEDLGTFKLDGSVRVGDSAEILQVENNGEIVSTPAKITTISVSPYPLESLPLLSFRLSSPLQSRDSSFVLPAVRGGHLLGLLMRYDARSQTAEVVPGQIIESFLARAAGNGNPGVPRAGFSFASTRDPQLRTFLGLQSPGGVLVTEVLPDSAAEAAGLRRGDVILSLGGKPIDQDGLYADPQFGKILFTHLIASFRQGDEPLDVTIHRKEGPATAAITPRPADPSTQASPPYHFDQAPRYFILGGLVFQELSRSFLREWGNNWRKTAPQRLVYLDAFQSELPPDRGKIVFLSAVLPSDETMGYENLENLVVTTVNGKSIKSLADLAAAAAAPLDGFHKIEFDEDPGTIFLDAGKVEEQKPALARDYGIPSMERL